MERLISVLRRPQAMVTLVSERVLPFSLATAGDGAAYSERVIPLAGVSEAVCPWRDKDVKAWRSLERVPNLSSRAALAIGRAVIGSVADPAAMVDDLPAPAFAGQPVDLRPHLCSAGGEQQLLDLLGDVLEQVADGLGFPSWHWDRRQEIATLPAEFRRQFLWGLHLSPWSMVTVTLAVYDQLELERHPDLARALSRLLSLADRKLGIAWCEAVIELAADQRSPAVEVIIESNGFGAPPDRDAIAALASADWPAAYRALADDD